MRTFTLSIYGLGLHLLIIGCTSSDISNKNEKNVGYFVSVFDKSVDYHCENKQKELQEDGKFECASFPITFYMDGTKLGEINSIHKDGYVYPQDIILLEDRTPTYTSQQDMDYYLSNQ
jgi:hypothetical protein